MTLKCVSRIIAIFSLFCLCLATQAVGATTIQLEEDQGVYKLPVRINGVLTLKFILDSGAFEVAIPADVAMTLIRTGTITDSDFLPGRTYRMADGSELKSTRLILREMEFGGIKITNVPCSVTPPAGDLLLGQSLLKKLNSWMLNNKRHVLIVDTATERLPLHSLEMKSSRSERSIPKSTMKQALDDAETMAAVDDSKGDYDYVGALNGAYKEYETSAERGNAKAQFYIGEMYRDGVGVPQDYAEAAKWLHKAADQGYASAQYALGMWYSDGDGEPEDFAEAAKWFRKAADQGDDRAQCSLGIMYAYGAGVPRDYVRAYMWLDISIAQLNAGGLTMRSELSSLMTPAQIVNAQRLAREWKQKHNK